MYLYQLEYFVVRPAGGTVPSVPLEALALTVHGAQLLQLALMPQEQLLQERWDIVHCQARRQWQSP